MQRSEHRVAVAYLEHFGSDYHALGEILAAVKHAVSYRAYFVHRGYDTLFRIGKRLHDETERYGVVVDNLLDDDGLAFVVGDFLLELSGKSGAYFLYDTFAEHTLVSHIDDLIFEGRTPCVQNQNFHLRLPFIAKW